MREQENNGGRSREPKAARYENGKKSRSIFLFGDFQIFNREGKDVVYQLPPKLRELFLMMITASFEPFTHISNKTITSHLWPGQDDYQAKNNRNVSVNRLRSVLEEVGGIKICCENSHWWVELESDVYCDYERLLTLLSARTLTTAAINELSAIVSRGDFMKEHEYHWFETGRMKLIDSALQKFKEQLQKYVDDPQRRGVVAECILRLDSLSESALRVKIQLLVHNGDHTTARLVFEHFRKEFQRIYGVEYKKSFSEMLSKS